MLKKLFTSLLSGKSNNRSNRISEDEQVRISKTSNVNTLNKKAYSLLREATKHKNIDLEYSINCLKDSIQLADDNNLIYGIQDRLRLPKYLQLAGRNDEAWSEYNKIVNKIISNTDPIGLKCGDLMYVYDSMRLHLQREKKFNKAIVFHVMSILYKVKLAHIANVKNNIEYYDIKDNLKKELCNQLKKTTKLDLLDPITNDVFNEIKKKTNIDVNQCAHKIKEYMNDGDETGHSE